MSKKSYLKRLEQQGKPVCYFCNKEIGKNGHPSKHHVFGRKLSSLWVWVHRKCHREHHATFGAEVYGGAK